MTRHMMVASTVKPSSLPSIAGFADLECLTFGRGENKSKRNNKADVCVRVIERKNHERCLVGCRFVCLFSVFA